MITAHELITSVYANVLDKQSKVYIQTVRIGKDGKPEVYLKEVSKLSYDHQRRKLILK